MGLMLLAEETVEATSIVDMLETAFTTVQTNFTDYVAVAIPIALAVWAVPVAIRLVKRLFSSVIS